MATGLADGAVVVWDTNVRAERFVCLRKHAAAVTHMAVTANLVLSLAADRTLHAHDISDDSETGQGLSLIHI